MPTLQHIVYALRTTLKHRCEQVEIDSGNQFLRLPCPDREHVGLTAWLSLETGKFWCIACGSSGHAEILACRFTGFECHHNKPSQAIPS